MLTAGNGEIGFSVDPTGLQSLNGSFNLPHFPLLTLSNWGWHAPDPRDPAIGAKESGFNPDGTLNYVYENVTIQSRGPKGNRTVPYVDIMKT